LDARAISLLATLCLLACAGHGSSAAGDARGPDDASPPAAPATTLAFDCDGLAFTALIREQTAQIILPERSLELRLVWAASGAKYTDGAVVFWSKGNEARSSSKPPAIAAAG
jgi:membrane-bound inhibitor of C-type lysozyme